MPAARVRVVYAGLDGHKSTTDRRENGIPLQREVFEWFERTTEALGVPGLAVA